MFQMMNEDDGFGLFNEADQKRFHTETGDAKQDAINYGRASGQFLTSLYRRIKQLCPETADFLPVCPAGPTRLPACTRARRSGPRGSSWRRRHALKEAGLQEVMPVLTTGGGTAAEVITGEHLDRFRASSNGCRVLLHDNNFSACSKVRRLPTDPKGRVPLPGQRGLLPAGYRDPPLHALGERHWMACQTRSYLARASRRSCGTCSRWTARR